MQRILVALDGSACAASIVPDARRLAGPNGKLILVLGVKSPTYVHGPGLASESPPVDGASQYLAEELGMLRGEGVNVEAHTLIGPNPAAAIDKAARAFGAHMIACATHGRAGIERLVWGSVAWRAMAHSPVPVLLRRFDASQTAQPEPSLRRILVPLDGSPRAEQALPLAVDLAEEWGAAIFLTQVVPDLASRPHPFPTYDVMPSDFDRDVTEAQAYLDRKAGELGREVYTHTFLGGIIPSLVQATQHWAITDIIMTSHGRTGLSRMLFGSVTEGLVQQVRCPIIVLPSMVVHRLERAQAAGHVEVSAARLTAIST